MASEVSRTSYGSTDKGEITVIGKQSYTDDGEKLVTTYEVRHGVRTIDSGLTMANAVRISKALASVPDAEPPAPVEEAPAPRGRS